MPGLPRPGPLGLDASLPIVEMLFLQMARIFHVLWRDHLVQGANDCENMSVMKGVSPDISGITCCDHGYGRPPWRPRVSAPATYRLGTPRNQHPAVVRWHAHLRGLATAIHEKSGLGKIKKVKDDAAA